MSPIHPGNVRFLIFIFGGWLTMARTLGMLVLLAVVLQGGPAGAGCDSQQAQCSRLGENFCGEPVGNVACIFQCCPADWTGCCLFEDAVGKAAQCCPGPPGYACAPDCKCVQPCGSAGECCGQNEVCVASSAPGLTTCCPTSQVCDDECCFPPQVCTPSGGCCTPGNECGTGCCVTGFCCNGVCCKATEGYACYGEGADAVCCAQEPCGGTCCPKNQKCRRKHKPPDCRCKMKAKGPKCGATPCPKHPKRMCGGTRCCEGDQCLDGACISPLP